MNDAEIFNEYCYSSLGSERMCAVLDIISMAARKNRYEFIDLNVSKKEIDKVFRALHMNKVLMENPLIDFSISDGFCVGEAHFTNFDDAVKAANNKVFL